MAKGGYGTIKTTPMKSFGTSSAGSRGGGISIPSFRSRPRPGYQTSSYRGIPKVAFTMGKKAF